MIILENIGKILVPGTNLLTYGKLVLSSKHSQLCLDERKLRLALVGTPNYVLTDGN